jgi:DNA-binding beta-propeller fold protein YncE
MWRLFLALALAGCGERVPSYQGEPFPHDPARPSLLGKIVTSNNGDDTLSLVDPAAPAAPQEIPVGFNPIDIEGPHHLSVDPAGRFVYVNLSLPATVIGVGPHGAHGASVRPGWVLKLDTRDGREVGRIDVDPNPGDNALTADGKTLFVTHYDVPVWLNNSGPGKDIRAGDSKLIVIDTETMTRKAKIPLCPAAHGVRLSPDDKQLYATCGPDEIAVVDLPAMTVRRVPLAPDIVENTGSCGRCPYALTVAPDGSVWVSSTGMGTNARGLVSIYDPALGDFDQAAHTQLRGPAMFAAFVGTRESYRAYVPERNDMGDHVHIYQPQPRGTPPLEIGDLALARADCQWAHMLLAEGSRGHLICEGNHTGPGSFVWLDLEARTVLGSKPIGVFPDGLALVRAR